MSRATRTLAGPDDAETPLDVAIASMALCTPSSGAFARAVACASQDTSSMPCASTHRQGKISESETARARSRPVAHPFCVDELDSVVGLGIMRCRDHKPNGQAAPKAGSEGG